MPNMATTVAIAAAPPPLQPPPALAAAHNLGKTYRQGAAAVRALVHASCTIRQGDRIALVGRSGSGKSTLLHLLGGLDTPSAGTLAWPALGMRETLRPAHVAFVFQTPSLLPALTAVENVALPLLLNHAPPAAAHAAAALALAQVGLEALANQLPEELSGGQAQRVAVARALATRPQLILADEPTGQLDHPTAQHLFDVLLEALAPTDTAFVVATHDLAIAARMTTQWQMREGVLYQPAL